MAEPWFEPSMFGALFGGLVGGVGGTGAGILGALAGTLAPQGKGRALILGGMYMFVALGLCLAVAGLVALILGQPWYIWFFPTQTGVIFAIVPGCLIPILKRRYREAEERRLEAESLRHS
jgi:hypothetical protein